MCENDFFPFAYILIFPVRCISLRTVSLEFGMRCGLREPADHKYTGFCAHSNTEILCVLQLFTGTTIYTNTSDSPAELCQFVAALC